MVGSATTSDRFGSGRRDERVSYVLRSSQTKHRFGISALAVHQQHLYTAGRDGTVRAWNVQYDHHHHDRDQLVTSSLNHAPFDAQRDTHACAGRGKHVRTYDEHVDWVNDVVLISQYDRLVSCSSDTCIKVWNAAQGTASLRTLVEHDDYVKALALVPNGVASAALDARVLVWDLIRGTIKNECKADADEISNTPSIYCMASSGDGNLLVTGSTDSTVSLWDVRTGDRVVHLKAHSDSVRCVQMNADGKLILSGSSDRTVKLWDLRKESMSKQYDQIVKGSVWALDVDQHFNTFVTGGRDGTVWHTDLHTGTGQMVIGRVDPKERSNMVLNVKMTPHADAVWVSNTGSTVTLWKMPSTSNPHLKNGHSMPAAPVGSGGAGRSENNRANTQPLLVDHNKLPGTKLCVIEGLPGIVAHKIMNDKRHVLTCDTVGEYNIWDITRGKVFKSLGVMHDANIEQVAKKYDREVSVPSWFTVDIRLGSLTVRLEKSNVSNAEIYAVDAGLSLDSEDIKVNIGEHVIRALFRKWYEEEQKKKSANEKPNIAGEEQSNTRLRNPTSKTAALRAAELPKYEMPDHISVIITEPRASVPILRKCVGAFNGSEADGVPTWVADMLRQGKGQAREPVKMSFNVSPWEGSDLPEIGTPTLNAPRVLRVKKVAVYIAKELKDERTTKERDGDNLEVLCNGEPLPSDMSLATVRQFRWKSPGELSLQFRLKKSSAKR